MVKALSPKQRNLSVQHELDQLQIKVAQVSESEEPLLFNEAAAVWVTLYGKARKSGRRLRGYFKEVKPEEPEAKKSLATVLRKRRQELQELVAAGAPVTLDPAVLFTQAQQLAGDVWTDKQRKECDRQDKVLRVRQLEAAAQHLQ